MKSLLKKAYKEALTRHVAAQKEKNAKLEIARKNKDADGYEKVLNEATTFDPIDLSFASQFPVGSQYFSFRTNLEYDNESYNILIRIQKVDEKDRFADRIEFFKIPYQGDSTVLKGSKGNYYQYHLGQSSTIRLIFGPKNKKAWRELGRQEK
ncbi:hypothetical protein [Pontimicrobium sp. MEBiC06410]